MALLDLLSTYNANIFLDTDPGWRQFISDHKTYLKSISQKNTPTPDLMTQVGHDLTWYLNAIGTNPAIAWIVGYINDLDSDLKFDHSMTLYVPSVGQLTTLYQSYVTTKQVKTG